MEYFSKEGLLKLQKEYEEAISEYEYARQQFGALEMMLNLLIVLSFVL